MRGLIISILAVWLSCAGVLTTMAQVTPGQPGMQGTTMTQTAIINVNTATIEQLMTVKGIGPTTAQNIIDYRTTNGPFKVVEDLDKVKGIGPMKLEGMKPFIVIQ